MHYTLPSQWQCWYVPETQLRQPETLNMEVFFGPALFAASAPRCGVVTKCLLCQDVGCSPAARETRIDTAAEHVRLIFTVSVTITRCIQDNMVDVWLQTSRILPGSTNKTVAIKYVWTILKHVYVKQNANMYIHAQPINDGRFIGCSSQIFTYLVFASLRCIAESMSTSL